MLYSPLYQSIRMILFGALSLSSLTVSAAITDDDQQMSEPLATEGAERAVADLNTASANDMAVTSLEKSTAIGSVTAVENNTALENDDAQIATDMDTEQIAVVDSTIEANTDTDITATNVEKLNFDDDTIQDSLMRLAEFYELKPNSDVTNANQAATNTAASLVDNDMTGAELDNTLETKQTLPKLGSDLNVVPITVDTAPRCEGQWVYPDRNPNYQRAINEANRDANAPLNNQDSIYAESDYGYYDNVDYAELSGNVIIDQGEQHIEAQKVVLDLSSGVAAAQGQVMFTDQAIGNAPNRGAGTERPAATVNDKVSQGGLIGVADSLAYNTQNQQSTARDVAFASVPLQAHGYAKQLNRPNESQYNLDGVMFTTCPPTDRKWQLEAKNIDLDTDTGRGEAYNTTFRIADVPVLYLPYFNFPIDSRRSSGFLLPNASIDSESGLEIDVPYYFNLAPNYDATLNTHLYTNRNPMLSGEFRYLTEDYGEGILNGSYLPNDKEYDGEDRSSLFYDHYWSSNSIPRLSGDAKYSYVSDADYLNDFDTLGLSDNTLNLPRRARLNYYNDYVNGELKVETYQTLDAFTNTGERLEDKDKPYSRLPQLSLNYRLPWSDNINFTGVHDSAYFKKSIDDGSEAEKSGVRVYNKLSAAYPIEAAWGYINPKLSLQHLYTSYDQDSLDANNLDEDDGSQSVFVPQASIDAGLNFYQSGSPFGAFDDTMGGYQLLSPRLKYTYSPFEDQNDIPNFNTRIASINYQQLFSDSWFLGYDRLQDLHAITPGINYRYIDATGVTRFDGSIAEQFYYGDGRVTLEDQTPVFDTDSSGMVWNTSTQPYNNVWVDVSGALNSSYDLNYITTELRYQPSSNSLFNVGFVKRQEDENTNQLPISALTASAIFPINSNWRVLAQGQYDYRRNQTLDALVGIDYEDCCIGFAVYGRRYYNDLNINDKPNQAIMAEIRLNGLGSDSGRLTRLLADKVLGFEPTQTAWKD
ncbi:LPS assembly protein LptD [uncultured Psychrobacter sp.]|uniref:LPS-assembly protein LptD n=1 Tax=uncultured Psychrobacter sp. TaxID=259303 RepID=UPI0026277623|nr:LPS assembly protein LptD [uncultured Psychrobacter sp.]